MIEKTFMTAMKDHFGFRSGQTLTDFMKEMKELSDTERAYFKKEFEQIGIKVTN
jgi:hypothetical protein